VVKILLGEVVPEKLLSRVVPETLFCRVEPETLLGRVELENLLGRVEPEKLLGRVVPEKLFDRVVPDKLLGRAVPETLFGKVVPAKLLGVVVSDKLLDRVEPGKLLGAVVPETLLGRVVVEKLLSAVVPERRFGEVVTKIPVCTVVINELASVAVVSVIFFVSFIVEYTSFVEVVNNALIVACAVNDMLPTVCNIDEPPTTVDVCIILSMELVDKMLPLILDIVLVLAGYVEAERSLALIVVPINPLVGNSYCLLGTSVVTELLIYGI